MDNNLDLIRDFNDFSNAVDQAIFEKRFYGRVSAPLAKKVSDTFTSTYSNFPKIKPSFEMGILFCKLIARMDDYNFITGNSFDLVSGVLKTTWASISNFLQHLPENNLSK